MRKQGLLGKILGDVLLESSYGRQDNAAAISFDEINNSTRSSTPSMTTLWRIAKSGQNDSDLKSIFLHGYKRDYTGSAGGNAYGPGLYCTWNLESTIHNMLHGNGRFYGDCITEMRLLGGYEGFVIFNERIARQTYGSDWRVENQLVRVSGIPYQEACKISQRIGSYNNPRSYHGTTSSYAQRLWGMLREDLYKKYKAKGLVFHGDTDGDVVVVMDFSRVIPFAVSKDNGRTFRKLFNKNLYNNLIVHPDTESRYGGKYKEVTRGINGYSIVMNDANKYNIVNTRNDREISPFWFDAIEGSINPNTGIFGFTYKGYNLKGSIFVPEGFDEDACLTDWYGQPFDSFSILDDLVKDMRAKGAKTFQEYDEMMSASEGEEQNESVNRLINKLVESVLYEDRTVDADGTVTIDNFDGIEKLLKPDTSDDVWFVQIIKRHKDNPTLHFERKACDFITYYLVHDANELEQKRSEIIAVCRATHSRAYIQPNKRSMVTISDYANNVLRPRFEKYRDKYRKGHEIEVAAGQPKDWPDRKLCFLDVDSNDDNVYRKVMQILNANGITPMWEYRSMNNGWHILLPDKEQVRNVDFSSIDNGVKMGMWSTVGLEIDKPLLLYASLKPNGYGVQQRVQQRKMGSGGHHRRR